MSRSLQAGLRGLASIHAHIHLQSMHRIFVGLQSSSVQLESSKHPSSITTVTALKNRYNMELHTKNIHARIRQYRHMVQHGLTRHS